jgi:DNA-binding NtrC family response regulator
LPGAARRQADGAAPLIGSSEAIRRVRERIERVAATDSSGPEPHPIF